MSNTPLLPVDQAIARIGAAVAPLQTELVSIADAGGRVLAEALTARRTQPPFDASAMDGYAVRAEDLKVVPCSVNVVGEAAAGGAYDTALTPGQAVRIFTGAPVPAGADSIVIQENTKRDGDTVLVQKSPTLGQHIRTAGIDFNEGDTYFARGYRLAAADIALAAAMNVGELPVFKRPRVAFFATGDELVQPGETPGPNQIVNSNGPGLAALIRELGGEPVDLGIARDTEASIQDCVKRAHDADILVTLGGVSVGDHDLIQPVLRSMGLEIDFWRIAMRPGKPLMFGMLGDLPFLGLPGNPVATLVCGHLFLRAAMDACQGRAAQHPPLVPVVLGSDLPANQARQDYIRARLTVATDGTWEAHPFSRQDSSMLSSLAQSQCLIVRVPNVPASDAGTPVLVHLLKAPDLSTD